MTCLTFSPITSEKCTNPYTLWLADTNNDVMKINNEKLKQLLTTSPTAYLIISRHSPVGALIPTPNELTKQKLYKIKHDKYCLPFIDLAVGARVMVTRNLATHIGIYNGATGIVAIPEEKFHSAIPEEKFLQVNTFHTLKNRELPIVFVSLDRCTGTQLSTDEDKHNRMCSIYRMC